MPLRKKDGGTQASSAQFGQSTLTGSSEWKVELNQFLVTSEQAA